MLPMALGLGVTAAVLLSLGAAIPVVADATRGYSSTAMLIALAILPIALVVVFVLRGRLVTAVGVLAGAAALAPGRAILDAQFLADPSAAARPELYRTEVFAVPGPGVGLWLLLAGHVATIAAGIVAVRALGPRSDSNEFGAGPGLNTRGLLLTATFAATVAAVGAMMRPFSTDDAFLPVGSAFESPGVVLAGCLVLAIALPVAAGLATSSGAVGLPTGGLLGLAAAVVAVALPNLVSGLVVDGLSVASGPIVMLVGAVGLVIVAFVAAGRAPVGDRVSTGGVDGERLAEVVTGGDEAGVANLPGLRRLWFVTGVLAVVTAALSLVGALTSQVLIVGDLPGPESPWRWLLLVAGLLVGVPGLALFAPKLATVVRPALSVCWAGVPLAGTAVLTTAITATELRAAGLTPGPGVLWTALAIVAAVATACCSVVAGMVERDSEDIAESADRPSPNATTPLVAGGILAIGGFGAPSILASDYVEPALWSNFGTPSWGLLLALVTVLGACFLAPKCRPARATALLAGATCVAGLRVAQYPLTDGVNGAHAGAGWWLALGCAVALLVATALAARPGPKPARARAKVTSKQ